MPILSFVIGQYGGVLDIRLAIAFSTLTLIVQNQRDQLIFHPTPSAAVHLLEPDPLLNANDP